MKRFYKTATVALLDQGFTIVLDGKPILTPEKKPLIIGSQNLAQFCCDEWNEQVDHILPHTMPITQIMMTAQDRTKIHKSDIIREVLNYIDTDLICYRAPETTPYGIEQKKLWAPCVSYIETRYDVTLNVTTVLEPLSQSLILKEKIKSDLESYDDLTLTILQSLTGDMGSIFIALYFVHENTDPRTIMEWISIDETIRSEIYNEDIHGAAPDQEKRSESILSFLNASSKVLGVLSSAK